MDESNQDAIRRLQAMGLPKELAIDGRGHVICGEYRRWLVTASEVDVQKWAEDMQSEEYGQPTWRELETVAWWPSGPRIVIEVFSEGQWHYQGEGRTGPGNNAASLADVIEYLRRTNIHDIRPTRCYIADGHANRTSAYFCGRPHDLRSHLPTR